MAVTYKFEYHQTIILISFLLFPTLINLEAFVDLA